MNTAAAEWYENNRERARDTNARWHRTNRERRIARSRELYERRVEETPERIMLQRCRGRAARHGIAFDLSEDDVVIPTNCPVLGIPIRAGFTGRRGPRPDSPSLDRIRPWLGYVRGNVRVISHRANTLKGDASVYELELVLVDLRRIESQSPNSRSSSEVPRVTPPPCDPPDAALGSLVTIK